MNLSKLKRLWKAEGFRPTKRMGQNFLHDDNVRDKILKYVNADPHDIIVEIGPGFGAITFQIRDRCRKMFVIEKDKKICEIMAPIFSASPGIELIQADALDIDFSRFIENSERIIVYGNIPYNISTPLLDKMIQERENIKNVYFVMQEEVVNRVVALPGTKDYGSLTCYAGYYTHPRKLLRIKKNSFFPVPKVESALLNLEVLRSPDIKVENETLFFKIMRGAFSQRRKKAINPLSQIFYPQISRAEWIDIFSSCGIDLMIRAESLSLEDFAALTKKAHDILSLPGK